MNISEQLKNKAISLGLCKQWTSEWGEPDNDELCEKYVRGIDFCIKNDYPSKEYMKYYFDGVMQNHGIYVDDKINLINPKMLVLNGKTNGDISLDGFSVSTMYVRHDSDVVINANGYSKVFVSIYDNAKVHIIQKDNANVYVYCHGGSFTYDGDVMVRDKRG